MTRVLVIISFIVFSQVGWTRGEENVMTHYTSSFRLLCYDSCDLHGESYYWCHNRKKWDYCSPKQNVDYEGYECRSDHPCGKYGESYYWCNRKSGGWGYCGIVEPKVLLYRSATYLALCRDDCWYDEEKNYYSCHTDQGWDYCSPLPDVTYKNEPCRSDSSCGTYGYSYSWCYTETGYDYCGVLDDSECQYESTSRVKRAPNDRILVCTRDDKGNKNMTRIYAEPNYIAITQVNNNMRSEAQRLISRWNNSYLRNRTTSNLIRSDQGHFRIDLQGIVNINNLHHYNLQIQINGPRPSGESTTVAQVLMPQNAEFPNRYVRRAFVESLNRRARVFITQIIYCLNRPRHSG